MRRFSLAMALTSALVCIPMAAAAEVTIKKDIVYAEAAVDGGARTAPLRLDLYLPDAKTSAKARPVFIFLHGGGFFRGSKDQQPAIIDLCKAFAEEGYVALSIDYRLMGQKPPVPPRLQPFADVIRVREEAQRTTIAAAVDDAGSALAWVKANAGRYGMDPERIVLGGSSAGAVTALYTTYVIDDFGQAASPRPRAVLDLWGNMGVFAQKLTATDAPVFIVHGEADKVAPFRGAEAIAEGAKRAGLAHEFHPMPNAGHGFEEIPVLTAVSKGRPLRDQMFAFFAKALQEPKPQ